METIPPEVKTEFFLNLSYPDILRLCQTNRAFANLCQDDSLWHQLFQRDYPELEGVPEKSWRENYTWARRGDLRIKPFIQEILRANPIANPKYARIDQMEQDSVDLILEFLEDPPTHIYSYDDLRSLIYDIFTIISGLNPDHPSFRSVEYYLKETTNDHLGDFVDFLKSLGYHMDHQDAIDYGFENEETEAPENETNDNENPEEEENYDKD
jgi:hypothetical protein